MKDPNWQIWLLNIFNMIKKIPLNQVKIGMCLAETVFDKSNKEIYKNNFYFTSRDQIVNLLDHGVKSVSIDFALSLSKEEKKKTTAPIPKIEDDPIKRFDMMKEKLPEVKELFDATGKVIEDIMNSARMGNALNKKQMQDQSSKIVETVLEDPQLAFSLLDLKNFDGYTFVHSVNVAVLSTAVALHLRFSQDKILSIAQGSILHDIGKAKIPLDLINKPGRLTDDEQKLMQRHPLLGVQIVTKDKINDNIIQEIIQYHHENYDGSGYPSRQQGGQSNRFASIVSIADYYDALTTKRSYKEAFEPHEAMKNIYTVSGTKFDPRVIHHFVRIVGVYPIGSVVELSDGRIATVIAFTPDNILKPVVKTLYSKSRPNVKVEEIIALSDSQLFIKGVHKGKPIKTLDLFV